MKQTETLFKEEAVIERLKHFLPSQLALKDFIHHNTLHAFQHETFFDALYQANTIFGYKTTMRLDEYKRMYWEGKIPDEIIKKTIIEVMPISDWQEIKNEMLMETDVLSYQREKVGRLRAQWRDIYKLDMETITNHSLFKILGSYLDQGIGDSEFRSASEGFLSSIRHIEQHTSFHFFNSSKARELLFDNELCITTCLDILIGDARYYEQYLFDQQFAHPGWSGFVVMCEQNPEMLFDRRKITLHEVILLELLIEIDTLDNKLGANTWKPLAEVVSEGPMALFEKEVPTRQWKILQMWQLSLEWAYYDQVIKGIQVSKSVAVPKPKFQAFFCIDDREESLRRWIEMVEPNGVTFGTPGHFNQLIKFRPNGGKFNAHVCPAPAQPKHIIVDGVDDVNRAKDIRFHGRSFSPLGGWFISQTYGFWSAVKLFINLFLPSKTSGHSSAFEHMSHTANPQYEYDGSHMDGFQMGFTVAEMAQIVGDELRKTGLTSSFAPIVYMIGHGGSSTNNPYYAGYNCGACSGKPGSLNARLFAQMANRDDVRKLLLQRAIDIPDETVFVGGLHDTTRDEIVFYDEDKLDRNAKVLHNQLDLSFKKALSLNAKERARQFVSSKMLLAPEVIHQDVKMRSYALFEPRPELNHSNNCLCIIGRREMTRPLFLDQRAFLASYDPLSDPEGRDLAAIITPATVVCGGINLEYYFSRVDNDRLGSGSKLPHNVVGLFGVANGVEGDLRTGLPMQMIDVHEPLRLMIIVEQLPSVVYSVIQSNNAIREWYDNEWIHLISIDPHTKVAFKYTKEGFVHHDPSVSHVGSISNQEEYISSSKANLALVQLM